MGIDYYHDLSGPFAHNEDELLDLLKKTNSWFNNKTYKKKHSKFVNDFNKFKDSNSSKRVYNEIVKE